MEWNYNVWENLISKLRFKLRNEEANEASEEYDGKHQRVKMTLFRCSAAKIQVVVIKRQIFVQNVKKLYVDINKCNTSNKN
ncbi:hypothetical protein BpHYR1_025197 [Brachionus plicatilis]|uniref:Uncharacterized protein n=1 Tax=Brachionus plicatilis TaxID=10195 RepID=A0A3M7SVL1_BRAPC|nr:hypothetical protein BpHYR1_025197 [Brachionus plicatilis]